MVKRPHARQMLLGMTSDPVLGPVIVFGAGGFDIEAVQGRAVTLPPLNRYLARHLIRRTRFATLLGPFRNRPPVDRDALENVLLRLSEMVCELPWRAELTQAFVKTLSEETWCFRFMDAVSELSPGELALRRQPRRRFVRIRPGGERCLAEAGHRPQSSWAC